MSGPAAILDDTLRPAAVLFDMDGTLLDSEKVWDVSLDELAAHLGGVLTAATRVAMVGSNIQACVGLLFDDLELPRDAERMAAAGTWLTARTAELFDEGLPWRPGAKALLEDVRAAGLRTALVTNTERALTERALGTLGRERFDVTVCGDEVAHGKPAPDPYLRGAQLLGLAPERCLAVEDSPTGTAAAEAAGCPVLVVPCEVPVPAGPRRVQRATLVGVRAVDLEHDWASVGGRTRGRRAPSTSAGSCASSSCNAGSSTPT